MYKTTNKPDNGFMLKQSWWHKATV